MDNRFSFDGVTLSGVYRHDTGGEVPKFDFSPRRYDYFGDGYSLVHHPVYDNAEDSAMANHSRLDLTTKLGMEAMASPLRLLDQSDLAIYTMLRAHNGKYLRAENGRIYADGGDFGDIHDFDASYMFLLVRKDNGMYFEVMNGQDNCIVNPETMNVELGRKALDEGMNLYRFGVLRYRKSDKIMIYTQMNQPWGLGFVTPYVKEDEQLKVTSVAAEFGKRGKYRVVSGWSSPNASGEVEHWVPYSGVKRFWSPYDGPARIPSATYGEHPNIVKATGILWGPHRTGQVSHRGRNTEGDVYKNASNNYILTMAYGSGADEGGILMGYDGRLRWVQYHGDLFDKFFNQTMTPKEVVDSVAPNFMLDLPYETQVVGKTPVEDAPWLMDGARQKLDVMQLKNTLTPAREFARKA